MNDAILFDKLSYLCDEGAWVRALDYAVHAKTVATFKKRLADWLPFFPDVAAVLETLSDEKDADFEEFRRGVQAEREKRFAGPEWTAKYGCVLIPRNALRATLLKGQFNVPWGAMLIRLSELDLDDEGDDSSASEQADGVSP